jgi:lipoic acid synthetase
MSACALTKPEWLRVKAPTGERVAQLTRLINEQRLNTVCSSAACPNMGECWDLGTATFMILGNQCTRACRFCNVQSKLRPSPVDLDEPRRLVESALAMKLKHVVITSVARDDLADGGARQFARCLQALQQDAPHVSTEVLVPDFLGNEEHLALVTSLSPTIFNHNLETVTRLTPKIRSGARYERSLLLLKTAKQQNPALRTKSGLMLGLGEEDEEILQALRDLRAHHVDQITIGQYLRPTSWHHPVMRYAPPELFNTLKIYAKNLGFSHVESGPLVRSSYHAEKGVVGA